MSEEPKPLKPEEKAKLLAEEKRRRALVDALDGVRKAGGNAKERWVEPVERARDHFESMKRLAENDRANPKQVSEALKGLIDRVMED